MLEKLKKSSFFNSLGKKHYYWIGAILILFLIATLGFVGYSTTPGFCQSCHVMKPYYEAWRTSKHNKVPCVDCHYAPGFKNVIRAKIQAMKSVVEFFTKTYSTRFYTEIEDASCLRPGCHQTQNLDTTIVFKQNIHFNHKHHLGEIKRGKKLRCVSCHSQVVVGEHITVTEKTCFLCHFKDRVDGIHPWGSNSAPNAISLRKKTSS